MSSDLRSVMPWLVSAKVTPPKRPPNMQSRLLLATDFLNSGSTPFLFVEAPAGFGKTTFLSELSECVRKRHNICAWLTVGREDGPGALLNYLAFSFEAAGIAIPTNALDPERAGQSSHSEIALGVILNAVEEHAGSAILMLDDLSELHEPESLDIISLLLKFRPGNLKVCLAYRHNPGLDFATYIVGEQSTLVGVDDLRFAMQDLAPFLGREVSRAEGKRLLAQSEGWAVALQIFKNRNAPTPDAQPTDMLFPTSEGLAADYFSTQLFRHLDAAHRAFLLNIALLDWVETALVSEVFGLSDMERRVEKLAPLNGLLVKLDTLEPTYRLHPLLQDYCRLIFKRERPDDYRNAQRSVAAAMARRGRVILALEHAKEGGSDELLATLIEQAGGVRLWMREGMTRMRAVDQYLTEPILQAYPRLAMIRCMILVKESRHIEARVLFDTVRSRTADFTQDHAGTDAEDLYLDHIFVSTLLAAYSCEPLAEDMLDRGLPTAASDETQDALTLGHHNTVLCLMNQQRAQFDKAWHAGLRASKLFADVNSDYGDMFIQFHLGAICMAKGLVQDAISYYARGRKIARTSFPKDAGPMVVIDVLTLELDLERGRVEGLMRRISSLIRKLESTEAWLDIYAAAYASRTELLLDEQRFEEALAALDDAAERADRLGLVGLASFLTALRADTLLRIGKNDDAAHLWHGCRLPTNAKAILSLKGQSWREMEYLALARIGLLLIEQKWDDARSLAKQLTEKSASLGLRRTYLRGLALWLKTEERAGNEAAAEALLIEFARLYRDTDYLTPLNHDRQLVPGIIDRIKAQATDTDILNDVGVLESAWAPRRDLSAEVPSFTDRELQVLQELSQGLQDKMIARRLGVTEHAVRYHLKKIYSKTMSRGRLEAVSKARSLGVVQ